VKKDARIHSYFPKPKWSWRARNVWETLPQNVVQCGQVRSQFRLEMKLVSNRLQCQEKTRQATYLKRNIAARSLHHYFHGTASITHSECLSVAVVTQYAKRMRPIILLSVNCPAVEATWNVMAHVQKPDFIFRRNGWVHLNRQGRQFSRLLQPRCAYQVLLLVVMLDIPCSEVVRRVLATHSFRQFPFTFPPVRHRVPSHFNWSLPYLSTLSHER
jgi:hypothetical protein